MRVGLPTCDWILGGQNRHNPDGRKLATWSVGENLLGQKSVRDLWVIILWVRRSLWYPVVKKLQVFSTFLIWFASWLPSFISHITGVADGFR